MTLRADLFLAQACGERLMRHRIAAFAPKDHDRGHHARHSLRRPARPLIAWSRDFPAHPGQVREARRFLAGILEGGPAADDAALCLSELAANACLHSRLPGAGRPLHRPRPAG